MPALVAILCPAYLQRAVPMALALYGATDVPFLNLLSESALLLVGEAVAIGLLWLRRRSLPDHDLMLTLVVFAATSTVVCFVDGKDWYYHRLPATVDHRAGADALDRDRTGAAPLADPPAADRRLLCGRGVLRVLDPAAGTGGSRSGRAEADNGRPAGDRSCATEHARTYIAFSEWIALGFPVVNETGVTWASRFDSMWALKGEIWRARFDPAADKEWPIARWVAHDFIAGCPDIAVVDTRETTKYIAVLSAADSAFARAWSRYRPIASFDGLVVYKRGQAGCLDVWVAAELAPVIRAGPAAVKQVAFRRLWRATSSMSPTREQARENRRSEGNQDPRIPGRADPRRGPRTGPARPSGHGGAQRRRRHRLGRRSLPRRRRHRSPTRRQRCSRRPT